MHVREARSHDAVAIATLHAESWRVAYRGALRDEFLDGDLVQDRTRVWKQRLSSPARNQLVFIATAEDQVLGFACAYGCEDEHWGTLLDNMHVRLDRQRQGVGKRLLSEVAMWCNAKYPSHGLYLWVLEQNSLARRFYERMGATDQGGDVWTPPGGGEVKRHRYAWSADELVCLRTLARHSTTC